MPYISKAARQLARRPATAGELNYILTRQVDSYLGHEYNYDRLNEVIGVLECAKLELYRRIVAPYEDVKIAENGDVYASARIGAADLPRTQH